MKLVWKKELNNNLIILNSAVNLWLESFDDNLLYANYFIKNYKNNYDYVFILVDDIVVSMGFVISKKIKLENKIKDVFFIVGVATSKLHSRKGLMQKIMNSILEKYNSEIIFMQADHWEYYVKWNFYEISFLYEYSIDYDKINVESYQDIDEKINWKNILNTFNNSNSISYEINDFKDYVHMLLISGCKIVSKNDSYIIFEKNYVIDYAYNNINDFLFLIKKFKINKLKSHNKIELKFFDLIEKRKYTKSNKKMSDIIFSTLF